MTPIPFLFIFSTKSKQKLPFSEPYSQFILLFTLKPVCKLGLTQWNLNSFEFKYLMIPDFPHNIKIRLAQFKIFCCVLTLLCLCPVGCLSETEQRQDAPKKIMASSNLNSKLLRFHCAHPNVSTVNWPRSHW